MPTGARYNQEVLIYHLAYPLYSIRAPLPLSQFVPQAPLYDLGGLFNLHQLSLRDELSSCSSPHPTNPPVF